MSSTVNNNTTTTNNNNNKNNPKTRRRGRGLIGLVCVSLCASTVTGFSNSMPAGRQPSIAAADPSPTVLSAFSSPALQSQSRSHRSPKKRTRGAAFPPLTPQEETEMLRRAVEYRRINQLEKDLALMHHNFLPKIGVRAEAAGYGDRLDDYEDAKLNGRLARETLVTRNMGLVRYCVNQIIGRETAVELNGNGNGSGRISGGMPLNSLSREDLLQEGAIGLARAVDKWNPEIGGKFSTYAVYWVRAAVLRCISERDELVRLPGHVSQAISKINKAAGRLGWVLQESGGILVTTDTGGRSSSKSVRALSNYHHHPNPQLRAVNAAKKLAEEAGLSEKHFEEAMTARRRRYTGGYVPVESWMQGRNHNSNTQSRFYSDENEDHDRRRMEESVANEDLRTVLSKHLRPKEMEALSWRYGLYEDDEEEEDQPQPVLQQHSSQLAGQSIKERANRQLLEMEDQLFGPSAVAAAAVAVPVPVSSRATRKNASKARVRPTKTVHKPSSSSLSSSPVKPGRFGEAMTFTEVGKKMQVSAEYTRRLCHKALGKLQQAAEDGTLEPALLF